MVITVKIKQMLKVLHYTFSSSLQFLQMLKKHEISLPSQKTHSNIIGNLEIVISLKKMKLIDENEQKLTEIMKMNLLCNENYFLILNLHN